MHQALNEFENYLWNNFAYYAHLLWLFFADYKILLVSFVGSRHQIFYRIYFLNYCINYFNTWCLDPRNLISAKILLPVTIHKNCCSLVFTNFKFIKTGSNTTFYGRYMKLFFLVSDTIGQNHHRRSNSITSHAPVVSTCIIYHLIFV